MFQVSIREEHGATIVSDGGSIGELLGIGKRPIERVVWGNDFTRIGEAVSDIRAVFTAVTLQVAEKAGKVERVGVPVPASVAAGFQADDPAGPMRDAGGKPVNRVAAHVNGNGHAPEEPEAAPAPATQPKPFTKQEALDEVDAFISLNGRSLWRLRKAGFKSLTAIREWAADSTRPGTRLLGGGVRQAARVALKEWDAKAARTEKKS